MPSDQDLVREAEECKATGNAAFGSNQLTAAIAAYTQGIVCMDRVTQKSFAITDHPASYTTSLEDDLKCVLLSNRAAARVKLGETSQSSKSAITNTNATATAVLFTDAVADCQSALPLCTKDAKLRSKILYRSAKARFMLANTDSDSSSRAAANTTKRLEHLQEAAKDLLTLLQTDPQNTEANQLMKMVRTQHKRETVDTQTPLTKILKALEEAVDGDSSEQEGSNATKATADTLQNIKLLLGLLQNDTSNGAMELGRSDGVPILLALVTRDFNPAAKDAHKIPTLALQCVNTAASHPPFVRTYLVPRQGQLVTLLTAIQGREGGAAFAAATDDQVVSLLSILDRILLHADRDPTQHDSIAQHTDLDYKVVLSCLDLALGSKTKDGPAAQPSSLVVRAVLNVLSVWTAAGLERETRIRTAAPNDLPPPKSPQDIRSFTPQQLAEYKKRELAIKQRDAAWARERSLACLKSPTFTSLLTVATNCPDHTVRREITVAVSRLASCLVDDDDATVKTTMQPFLNANSTGSSKRQGPIIEEIYNDDGKIEDDEDEKVAAPSLATKMQRALITTALLLSKKECGAWALSTGWTDAGEEISDLITKSDDNVAAQCLAAEVLQAAAVVEATRGLVMGLVSSGCIERLMTSPDRDVRSGAAAAVAKLGLSDKATQGDAGELMGLLQAACEMLDDNETSNDSSIAAVKKVETKHEFNKFSSVATSSVERAIEMMTYLVAHTVIKEELAAGFGSTRTNKSALESLVQAADLPGAGESLSGFGLATIFQLLAATNEQLRKEAFEGKEVTMDQYDEMQRMGKTEEEKEVMDQEKDTDTKEGCSDRIRKMASANVPRALVALTEGASEHTLEQLTGAMSRMAEEQSVRGVMIQQGVLSACIKVEKAEGPTETDVMKKVIRTARHCLAKMLITTNPTLLTSAQKLGSIRPLLQLVRDIKGSDLQHFEALLAVTNIASSGDDAKNRIVSERGIPCLHFAMFSDHEMVRRAATEAMCNLVPHQAMMEHLAEVDNMRLWMAFAVDYEDHYECARAAGGCLAMASQDEPIALVIAQLEKFKEQVSTLLESGRLELMQRALVLVLNLVSLDGSTARQSTIEAGLVDFCRAYIELQQHAATDGGDLEFSPEERQLLPLTVDIAKKIVQTSDE